jgi:hypothetical protein
MVFFMSLVLFYILIPLNGINMSLVLFYILIPLNGVFYVTSVVLCVDPSK